MKKSIDGEATYYLYSDEGLVAEYGADRALSKAYGWKPGGTWGTDPVYMSEAGQYYWYHNDHLGTPETKGLNRFAVRVQVCNLNPEFGCPDRTALSAEGGYPNLMVMPA